jgi:hypothetical protein
LVNHHLVQVETLLRRRSEVERRVGHHPPGDRDEGFRHVGRGLEHVPEHRQPATRPQHMRRLGGSRDRVHPVPSLPGDDRVEVPAAGSQSSNVATSTSAPLRSANWAIRASGSTPSTLQPAAWNCRASMPVPQPTSRTSGPGLAATIRSTIASG